MRLELGLRYREPQRGQAFEECRERDREVWSDGLSTVDKCTKAYGAVGHPDRVYAADTEERC